MNNRKINPVNEDKKYYYESWYLLFRELKGWTKEQVDKWAERWRDKEDGHHWLDDENDLFYHEIPLYWAINWLIPEDLHKQNRYKLPDEPGYGEKDKRIWEFFHFLPMEAEKIIWHHADTNKEGYNFGTEYEKTDWVKLRKELDDFYEKKRSEIKAIVEQ